MKLEALLLFKRKFTGESLGSYNTQPVKGCELHKHIGKPARTYPPNFHGFPVATAGMPLSLATKNH